MTDAEQILAELLNKIIAERELSNAQVKIQPVTSGGANYSSQLFHATISDGLTELKLFAKVAAVGKKFREQAPIRLFDIENAFYTRLNKSYEELQDKHNVRQDKRFISPVLYGCSTKLYEEIVVLENLAAQGFTVYDRMISVDWEYASKAVEELAKFHALSIVFEKEKKENLDQFLAEFQTPWNLGDIMKDVIDKGIDAVKEEYKDRLAAFFKSFESTSFEEMFKPLRLRVLIHGDYRASNLMHRKDADGRMHIRIVDYQTIRGGSPVIDLLYFIMTGTDKNFRAQYYEKLLDHYYTQLSLAMKRLHLDPDELYSREDFDFEFNSKLRYGLSIAMFTLPIITIEEEHAPQVGKDMEIPSFIACKTSNLFPDRLNGIVSDYIRWGLM